MTMRVTSVDEEFIHGDTSRCDWATRLLFLGMVCVAWLIYRPDRAAPFDIIDFSETLPYLTADLSAWRKLHDVYAYYVGHGRATPLLSSFLVARYAIFGQWTPGWQWLHFGIMVAVCVTAFHLLRRLGNSKAGAVVGTTLFLASPAAVPGWIRPSVNEGVGTLALLAASSLAVGYSEVGRYWRPLAAIAILLATAVLAKEMLIAATPFVLVIAVLRDTNGQLRWPTSSARHRSMVVVAGATLAVSLLPAVHALLHARADGYARQFSAEALSLDNGVFAVMPLILPITPIAAHGMWAVSMASIAWFGLLLVGCAIGYRSALLRQRGITALALAALMIACRLIAYLPWPLQFPYYSLPFLIGPALLASHAVTSLDKVSCRTCRLAIGAAAIWLAYNALDSHSTAARAFTTRHLASASVGVLGDVSASNPDLQLFTAVSQPKVPSWTGLGATLSRYAAATGRDMPAISDVVCSDAVDTARHAIVLAYDWQCQVPLSPRVRRSFESARWDWQMLGWASDTLRFLIYVPSDSTGK